MASRTICERSSASGSGVMAAIQNDVVLGEDHPFPYREGAQAFVPRGGPDPGAQAIRIDLFNVLQQPQPRRLGNIRRVVSVSLKSLVMAQMSLEFWSIRRSHAHLSPFTPDPRGAADQAIPWLPCSAIWVPS
jgi:hypothetical protein